MKLKVIAANQTEIEKDNGNTVFFSYNTPVAVFVPGRGGLVTEKKWSRTTSKHCTQAIARWGCTRTNVPQSEIDALASQPTQRKANK